jgi:hypothetical protein
VFIDVRRHLHLCGKQEQKTMFAFFSIIGEKELWDSPEAIMSTTGPANNDVCRDNSGD